MKCPKCGGNGKEYWNGNVFCNTGFECDKCHGTGEVEQTNEEWFASLSTEEKANFFHDIVIRSVQATWDGKKPDYPTYLYDWEMWLKQPHTFK